LPLFDVPEDVFLLIEGIREAPPPFENTPPSLPKGRGQGDRLLRNPVKIVDISAYLLNWIWLPG
jgi:hypothetical protein